MASPSPPSSPPQPNKKLKMSSTTTTSDDEAQPASANATSPSAAEAKRRYKRRKIAIFLAYCGSGYQGMQKNPGARTIEGDLEEALFLSGAVPEPDRARPKRYDWARSARTDKGVSAAGQVVSGRFYIDPPGLVDRLNSNLPDQIRIFGFKRVTASFNAKKFCDRRRYVYLLPVFALDPNAHPDRESVIASLGSGNELARCLECSERGRKVEGLMGRQSRVSKVEETDLGDDGGGMGVEDGIALLNPGTVLESTVSVVEAKSELGSAELEPGESGVLILEGKNELGYGDFEVEGNDHCGVLLTPGSGVESRISVLEEKFKIGNGGINPEESRISQEDESSKSVKEGFVIGEKFTVGTSVLSEEGSEGKIEPGFLKCTNGEQMGVRNSVFHYGDKERERFNRILKRYMGTHNFHNFTTRTKAEDPSARRYIISFDADRVVNIEGIEFVRCEVVGQSFMLHQIRKMIGLAVAIMRNCAPESLMDAALRQDLSINVPTAPEVGLYLDECLFTSYNQKWKDSHEELSMKAYAEESEDFKLKHIYSHIASMEHKEGAVALWLHSLNHRNYPDFNFLETDRNCVIAEQAQVNDLAN